jgi:hypothetical protein
MYTVPSIHSCRLFSVIASPQSFLWWLIVLTATLRVLAAELPGQRSGVGRAHVLAGRADWAGRAGGAATGSTAPGAGRCELAE